MKKETFILILKILATIFLYPIVFCLTCFGLPFQNWCELINLAQKDSPAVRILKKEIEKGIGLKADDIEKVDHLGGIEYSDENLEMYKEIIRGNNSIVLTTPSSFDYTETYLNLYSLKTINNENYLFIEVDYADFRMAEVIYYVKI
jgi:hypothetical protein